MRMLFGVVYAAFPLRKMVKETEISQKSTFGYCSWNAGRNLTLTLSWTRTLKFIQVLGKRYRCGGWSGRLPFRSSFDQTCPLCTIFLLVLQEWVILESQDLIAAKISVDPIPSQVP